MGEVSKSSAPLHESHFRCPWERLVDNKINVDNNERMPEKVLLRKLSVCSVRAIQQGGSVRARCHKNDPHLPLAPHANCLDPLVNTTRLYNFLVLWSVTLTFPLRFGHARFFFSSGPKLIILVLVQHISFKLVEKKWLSDEGSCQAWKEQCFAFATFFLVWPWFCQLAFP